MKTKKLPPNWRRRYEDYLRERERSEGTIRQYLRDVEHFFKQQKSDSAMPDSCRLQDWKEGLIEQGYAVSSINGMIAAVNGLLCCLGLEREKLKPLRQQRKIFCQKERQLSREEYLRLVNTALQKGGPPPGAGAADHLFDRDPHLGAAVYHRRDAAASKDDGSQQGENSGDPAAAPAVCRAQRLGKGRSHPEWTGLCYPERTSAGSLQRLVTDERAVCRGAGGPEQGLSAQSAPPVCPHLLPDGEGSEPSGRPAGSQQHPDHPYLSHGEWGGAPADAGEDAAAAIKKHHKMILLW